MRVYCIATFEARHGLDFSEILKIARRREKREEGKGEIEALYFLPKGEMESEEDLLQKIKKIEESGFLKEESEEDSFDKIFQEAIKKGEWLLVLRVDTIKVDGQYVPLTIKKMFEVLEPDMKAKGQGMLLWNREWYQTEALIIEARRVGFNPNKIRRRTPVETADDFQLKEQ